MLKSFLTPLLKSAFDDPGSSTQPSNVLPVGDESTPEDFAHDVRVEIMRRTVEDLRSVTDEHAQFEGFDQIYAVMRQESRMKDIFAELDGFLLVVNALSVLRDIDHSSDAWDKAMCAAFRALIESLSTNSGNAARFEATVGPQSLLHALKPSNFSNSTYRLFGLLLALALTDTSLFGFFSITGEVLDVEALDAKVESYDFSLQTLQHPSAIFVLFDICISLTPPPGLAYLVMRSIDRVTASSPHNQAQINTSGLISALAKLIFSENTGTSYPEPTHRTMKKTLRRLLELGFTSADETRSLLRSTLSESVVNSEVVSALQAGSKSKWPEFFSFQSGASLTFVDESGKTFPPTLGFTFSTWVYIQTSPVVSDAPLTIFGARSASPSRWIARLNLLPDGVLEFVTPSTREALLSPLNAVRQGRWTHIALVHQYLKTSSPTVFLYVDGRNICAKSSAYPRPSPPPTTYHIGQDPSLKLDLDDDFPLSCWYMASCHFISYALPPDIPLLMHRLGPRYNGNYQDASLFRFLTYQMYTSINVHLFRQQGVPVSAAGSKDRLTLSKALVGEIGFDESHVILSLAPNGTLIDTIDRGGILSSRAVLNSGLHQIGDAYAMINGQVVVSKTKGLDLALWQAGGPPVVLKLVQMATTAEQLLSSLHLLFETVRTSWRNAEDMEKLQGYDVLVSILRSKSSIFSHEAYRILFAFMGLDYANPEESVVVSSAAYRSIGLDFFFWSSVSLDLQVYYWQHFEILLKRSKFHRFNIKQRFHKKFTTPGPIRMALFILQTDLYSSEIVPYIVNAIEVIAGATWSTDIAIKPIVSYLAANLQAPNYPVKSPFSVRSVAMSRIDRVHAHEKAEQVLQALVSILHVDTNLVKFSAALPSARIAILLLGTSPSSFVAVQVLRFIGLHLASFPAFTRKLDLANFWAVLKALLPRVWDSRVQAAAFDILLGHFKPPTRAAQAEPVVRCSSILPAILCSLEFGMSKFLEVRAHVGENFQLLNVLQHEDQLESDMEALIEQLIELQASSSSFRTIFRGKYLDMYIATARSFIVSTSEHGLENGSRLSDKLLHLATMLTFDTGTPASQIRQLRELAQSNDTTRWPKASTSGIQPDPVALNTLQRIASWRTTIVATERQRRRKTYQDLREKLRAMRRLTHWEALVHHERGLWPTSSPPKWRLDETEGPYRIRKKLETEVEVTLIPNIQADVLPRDLVDAEDWMSVNQVTAPWDEAFDFSVSEENQGWDDEDDEDRLRKIRHELEPGDVIEVVANVARIVGVDSSPGLFIFGQTHLYVRDGLVESSAGEILEAIDAPKDVLSIPGTLLVDSDPNIRARRWNLDALASFTTRTYLFRDVALEIYFKDSRSLLCVFASKKARQPILAKLQKRLSAPSKTTQSPSFLRTPLVNYIPSATRVYLNQPEIDTAQRRWQAREISNFAYLSILNQASGRTPNDLTQYPIFPWVLKDYTSQVLDLASSESYRDLSTPMGALTPQRREAAIARYEALTEIGEPPFNYGTHMSSSMITSHFLIRLEPFSRHFKSLQGGDFDLPERLFVDISRAWDSASVESRGDVRELIPEFFTCPEFLQNLSGLELGSNAGGEKIGDVRLPPWARNDPLLFIHLHRKALESDYVSRNLPAWIDLIWGTRQRDVSSCNVFHPLSYEGGIDLDSIKDEHELAASVGIIHNFGQTPRKIFSSPHPPRYMDGELSLPLGSLHGIPEHSHLLLQSSKAIRTLPSGGAIGSLFVDSMNEKVVPTALKSLHVPGHLHERVQWGFKDQSLRLFVDRKLIQIVESAAVNCATFSDGEVFVTGGTDNLLSLWRVVRAQSLVGGARLKISHLLRGHSDVVTCISASRAWSLVVSGSNDRSAIVWDLNRATYVRSLWHDRGLVACTISETTGDIVTCSISRLSIHTINGHHIASVRISPSEPILSVALHERETSMIPILACGSSNGSITLRTWNAYATPENESQAQWKVITVRGLKLRREPKDDGWIPNVTALCFVGETLYSGDESGRMFAWTLPD